VADRHSPSPPSLLSAATHAHTHRNTFSQPCRNPPPREVEGGRPTTDASGTHMHTTRRSPAPRSSRATVPRSRPFARPADRPAARKAPVRGSCSVHGCGPRSRHVMSRRHDHRQAVASDHPPAAAAKSALSRQPSGLQENRLPTYTQPACGSDPSTSLPTETSPYTVALSRGCRPVFRHMRREQYSAVACTAINACASRRPRMSGSP